MKQREIKFRVWYHHRHNNDNGWIEYLSLGINKTYQNVFILAKELPRHGTGYYLPIKDFQHDLDFAMMQFTGLYDRNGIEIYEGDVLQWLTDESMRNHEIIEYDYERERYLVKYERGAFVVEWLGNREIEADYIGESVDFMDSFKVIGNIYENPELYEHTT